MTQRHEFAAWLTRFAPLIERAESAVSYSVYVSPDEAHELRLAVNRAGLDDVMRIFEVPAFGPGSYTWHENQQIQYGDVATLDEVLQAMGRLGLGELRLEAATEAMENDEPYTIRFDPNDRQQPGDPEPPQSRPAPEEVVSEVKPEVADVVQALLAEMESAVSRWVDRFKRYL